MACTVLSVSQLIYDMTCYGKFRCMLHGKPFRKAADGSV